MLRKTHHISLTAAPLAIKKNWPALVKAQHMGCSITCSWKYSLLKRYSRKSKPTFIEHVPSVKHKAIPYICHYF